RMHHPMKNFETLAEMQAYPLPDYTLVDFSPLQKKIDEIHAKGLAVFVWQECTIWETAWYLRSMENLMMDMAMEDEKAVWLLDQITEKACYRAAIFARQGADILGLGDDIGMQDSIMMSMEMYQQWLKPRLAKVIRAAKNVNPDILISYHSCGYIEPFINELIEVGVDILNPVQVKASDMDSKKIKKEFGNEITFWGGGCDPEVLLKGTKKEIEEEVKMRIEDLSPSGGFIFAPIHSIQANTPPENIAVMYETAIKYRKY
ncbi:MAG: uroporphyrinogen decarboxylase family protein, partial [Actinomycetota bacterium]